MEEKNAGYDELRKADLNSRTTEILQNDLRDIRKTKWAKRMVEFFSIHFPLGSNRDKLVVAQAFWEEFQEDIEDSLPLDLLQIPSTTYVWQNTDDRNFGIEKSRMIDPSFKASYTHGLNALRRAHPGEKELRTVGWFKARTNAELRAIEGFRNKDFLFFGPALGRK